MKTIVLLGKNGQLGWELHRTLAPLGRVIAYSQAEMDLKNIDFCRTEILRLRPNIIINAAAYTAVDKAENHSEEAYLINGEAPGMLAQIAANCNIPFVHFSTDYIFDGRAQAPYREEETPCPLNYYGQTKLAGEELIRQVGGKSLVFRTSWVYAARGKNFMLTMLRIAKEKKQLRVVFDQWGAPTWARMLAGAATLVVARALHHEESMLGKWGVYHMTAADQTSWHGFAEAIFHGYQALANQAGDTSFVLPELIPIPSEDYPLPAPRPKYSVLSNEKLLAQFGIRLPTWKDSLELCLREHYEKY